MIKNIGKVASGLTIPGANCGIMTPETTEKEVKP
jgi:hypothetical protein